ncbi:hypothetical protein CCR91_12095 [Thiorhodovibrio winogradskyi]|nr:hypothetical protein [Thiorhodovibrio winogradskyi]
MKQLMKALAFNKGYSEGSMIVGLLMLLLPVLVYLATFPVSRRLRPSIRLVYRILGGILVFVGSATSLYFAAYTGDQGGIAAFFFQIVVISTYVLFSIVLVVANWLMRKQEKK